MQLTFSNNDFSGPQSYMLRDLVMGLGYDLGLDDYPIFDEAYRPKLNKAIYDHFAFRRIASETPAKFIFYLNRYMRENMPTYNAIYKTINKEGFDFTATSVREDEGSSANKNASNDASTSSGDAKAINSNTPQVYLENAEDPKYMNTLAHNFSKGDASNSSTSTADSSFTGKSKAMDGGYAAVIYDMMASQYMATDVLVFQMLEPLFLQYFDDFPR